MASSRVQAVEGRNRQLDPVCVHTTGPASKLPAGKGRDQTINQFNELWLLWVLPVCYALPSQEAVPRKDADNDIRKR